MAVAHSYCYKLLLLQIQEYQMNISSIATKLLPYQLLLYHKLMMPGEFMKLRVGEFQNQAPFVEIL